MLSENTATILARLGFGARGLVYVLVGGFAVDAAMRGGEAADKRGAIASLAQQPLGEVLLAVVAVGLAGYALWRLTEAALNPERIDNDVKGVLKRAGFAVSGLAHALLAWSTLAVALHRSKTRPGSSPEDENARDWTAWLLSQPFGRVLVGVLALVFVLGAFKQVQKAWTGAFAQDLRGDTPMPGHLCTLGRAGYGARAVVFLIIGLFFAAAAWQARASEAGGFADALGALQARPGGAWLLALTGLGLALFGLYGMVEAWYRRVRVVLPG